ncbi:hypothetical protein PG994_002452 [Apiospora phragmitis]|uniref:DUF7702 domain-containing protein n=1 Tax=Apiospora phragmitis TaxID=2905665 RepID=A0ABR1WWG5_9PEZI
MYNAHRASAIAQIVFYAPIVPITLYVGIRAWRYGPRMAWYPAMAFACALRSLEAESKSKKLFIGLTRGLLLGAVGLLGTAGGFTGDPEMADTQTTLFKIAYFEFVFVLLALVAMAVWLNFWRHDRIKDGQIIYIRWLLISSPFLCIRAVFGVISVFESAGANIGTSIWSPLFGRALLFSPMALLPEYIVLCVFVYLGIHRISTAERYGLIAQKRFFKRTDDIKSKGERGSTEMA